MDTYGKIRQVVNQRKQEEKQGQEQYNSLCKKRLIGMLKKKFQTVFIGGIDEIEKTFGKLWGYGKNQEDLTDTEQKWLKVWMEMRERILTKGNNQIRGMESEMDNHTVIWNRYCTNFKISPTYGEGEDNVE